MGFVSRRITKKSSMHAMDETPIILQATSQAERPLKRSEKKFKGVAKLRRKMTMIPRTVAITPTR
jgi:hypothetical protein